MEQSTPMKPSKQVHVPRHTEHTPRPEHIETNLEDGVDDTCTPGAEVRSSQTWPRA